MALRKAAWVYPPGGEKPSCNDHSFQSHTDRVCPAFKKWYNFFTEIKSSPSIKHKHIRPLSYYLRVQTPTLGIKFGIGQVDVRTSTYEHLRLLWWPKWNSDRTPIIQMWRRRSDGFCGRLRWYIHQAEKDSAATINHSSCMWLDKYT